MAATYDLTTNVGKVRLIIGDTDVHPESDAIFTDAEINHFLTVNGSDIDLAAADALEAWIAKYLTSPTTEKIGDYSYSQNIVANMNKRVVELRDKVAKSPILEISEMDLETTPDGVETGA